MDNGSQSSNGISMTIMQVQFDHSGGVLNQSLNSALKQQGLHGLVSYVLISSHHIDHLIAGPRVDILASSSSTAQVVVSVGHPIHWRLPWHSSE